MLPQLGLGLAFVAALFVAPPVTTAEPVCADERAEHKSAVNLANCEKTRRKAEDAGDGRRAAQAHARILMYARQIYEQGRTGASRLWFTKAGDDTIHYGTSKCALASELETEQARKLLEDCIDLLSLYLDDLADNGASASVSANTATKRRLALRKQYEKIEPPPTPLPLEKNEEENPNRMGSDVQDGPSSSLPNRIGGDVPDRPSKSLSRAKPYGLWAGLGTSAALAVASAALLVIGDTRGRKAARSLEASEAAESMTADSLCELTPTLAGCQTVQRAQGLFIAGAVGLGASLAGTAVFAGLLVRHRRTHTQLKALRMTPWITRSGFYASITLRF